MSIETASNSNVEFDHSSEENDSNSFYKDLHCNEEKEFYKILH